MGQTDVALFPAVGWGDLVEHDDGEFLLPVGTVTLLLADVEGSTRQWEQSESEMGSAMAELSAFVSELIGQHDGVRPLEQGEGDSFVAAFARPSEAVTCAVALQQKLADGPLAVRIGLHSGEVQRGSDRTYVGPALNRAARLRDAGHGGQVLVSRSTAELVADRLPAGVTLVDLGSHRLKDLARPEHIYQLAHADLRDAFPPLRTLDTYRHNLPVQRTPLFGRRAETTEVIQLVSNERLVTLHGGGGYGKTRLALNVAAGLIEAHPNGVFFVDLSSVRTVTGIPRAVLDAMGLDNESESVLAPYVADKQMLLVLDNCEHLIEGCAQLADQLLSASETLRLLTTSREPLGVAGEVTYRVPSLAVPSEVAITGLEGLTPYAAVELFIDRAHRARADFDPSVDDMCAIADVCRRLDGVPLAIELAAARMRSMTPAEVADGLSARFRLLTGASRTALPRQQTLRASIDWSYDLLTDAERAVFRRLAVFVGGFSLEAAKAAASSEAVATHQVVDLLSLLVDKSLVVAEPSAGTTRYRLLETVREYADELLENGGERDDARTRHRNHYMAEADRRMQTAMDPESEAAELRWFQQALDNLWAGYRWSLEREDADALALIACVIAEHPMNSFVRATRFDEVTARLDRVSPEVRSRYLRLAVYKGDVGASAAAYMEADRAWCLERGLDARAAVLEAMIRRASWTPGTQVSPNDLKDLERAAVVAAEGGDRWDESLIIGLTMIVVEFAIEDVDAEPYWERAIERATMAGSDILVKVWVLEHIHNRCIKGNFRRAIALANCDELQALDGAMALELHNSQARWLVAAGAFAEANVVLDAMEARAREFGSPDMLAFAAHRRGRLYLLEGDLDAAEAEHRRALDALVRSANFFTIPNIVRLNSDLAELAAMRGHWDRAEQSITAARNISFARWTTGYVNKAAACVARLRGDLDRAEDLAHEALAAGRGIADTSSVTILLEFLAGLAVEQESYAEAVRLFGAVQSTRDERGDLTRYAPCATWYAEDVEAARAALGSDEFAALWAEGAAMTWREAVDYARRGRGTRKRPSSGWASLTPAEEQVVALVAEGLSNAAVAERLFISTRTVGTHLSHVYTKVGISSRTELAAAVHRRSGG